MLDAKERELVEIQTDEDDDEVLVVEPFEDDWDLDEELKRNTEIVGKFADYLEKNGLKENTIDRHVSNTLLFVNDWLACREGLPIEDGPESIDGFLGNYYIRRCMWSTPSNIKTTAASIKKFYKYLSETGVINAATYRELVETIKGDLPDWQYRCTLYNSQYTEWDDIKHLFPEWL